MNAPKLAAFATCSMLTSCALEAGTGGQLIAYEFSVLTDVPVDEPFTTLSGWTVQFDSAYIALGPAWLYENPAASALQSPNRDWIARARDFLIPTAHAHPGDAFFNGGQLRGEFLEQHVYDLLDDTLTLLGDARGVAGPCGTMTLVLDPPSSAIIGDPAPLDGYPVWIAGQAQREVEGEMQVVNFAGGLELDADERELNAIKADFDLAQGDQVILRVDVQSWLDEAQFDRLEVADENGVMIIEPDSQVAIAWKLALRNANNYRVSNPSDA